MRASFMLGLVFLITQSAVSEALAAEEIADRQNAAKEAKKKGPTDATFMVNKKTYPLKHAVAFQGYWFDEKVPMLLFCEKPIPLDKLKAAVKNGFDKQEMFMLRLGRYLLIRFTSADTPTISGWADNLSLGSTSDLKSDTKIKDNHIQGTVAMPQPEELGPFKYQFKARFDLAITKLE